MILIAIDHDMSFKDKLMAINSHYIGEYDG